MFLLSFARLSDPLGKDSCRVLGVEGHGKLGSHGDVLLWDFGFKARFVLKSSRLA